MFIFLESSLRFVGKFFTIIPLNDHSLHLSDVKKELQELQEYDISF